MLSWRRAKADLTLVLKYQKDLGEFWKYESVASEALQHSYRTSFLLPGENQRAIQREASRDPQYQIVRDRVARATNRIKRIAWQNGIGVDLKSLPPPAVGGAIIPINIFDAVLHDYSHGGIERQWIVDTLNQTRGAAAERVESEFWKLVNPFQWIKDALILVLRLPFMLIETTGFDVGKVEDHFLGKAFKFAELALLLWIALKLGLGKEELHALAEKIITK